MEIRFVLDISKDLKDTINSLSRSLLALAAHRVETAVNAQECPQLATGATETQNATETTPEPENAPETQNKATKRRTKKTARAENPASYPQVNATEPKNVQETPQLASGATQTEKTIETTPEPENAPETQNRDFSDEGKGATGEELAALTARAIEELADVLESGNRMRAYCAKLGILIPTSAALIQAVGYDMTMAICKGEIK